MLIFTPLIFGWFLAVGWVLQQMRRDRPGPPPDPSMRRVDGGRVSDYQWMTVEADWLEFLDAWPVLDQEPS